MLILETNTLAIIIFVMMLIITMLYGNSEYWKARAKSLEEQKDNGDGWRSEALFLRHRANAKAAEFAEYN